MSFFTSLPVVFQFFRNYITSDKRTQKASGLKVVLGSEDIVLGVTQLHRCSHTPDPGSPRGDSKPTLCTTAGKGSYILERLHYEGFKMKVKSPNLNSSENPSPEIQVFEVLKRS